MEFIVTENQLEIFLKRRFFPEELEWIINDVQKKMGDGESLDIALYDGIRALIKSKKFYDIDEHGDDQTYWDSYLKYETPLVAYVKSKLK